MKYLPLITKSLVLPALLWASAVFAAPYGHVHLTATNAQTGVDWYARHLGGAPAGFGGATGAGVTIDRLMFGDMSIIFYEREPTAGSVGSGADHIGFSLDNVPQVVANIVADGGKQLGDLVEFAGMQIGFVEDPWGTKIELINDSALRGLHHIHLSSPAPEATLAWYGENFGGTPARFGGALPGLFYGNLWLLVSQARVELAPTAGRSLDHLGWNFSDLDATAAALEANGVKITMPPRDYRDIRIGFAEGPDGVRIELVQP